DRVQRSRPLIVTITINGDRPASQQLMDNKWKTIEVGMTPKLAILRKPSARPLISLLTFHL
ncbi:MAG: hypothetical protein Q9173_006678, partial [Seirophora scorigena]